ncbi:helix-turn-helix protein [compost metagenome]
MDVSKQVGLSIRKIREELNSSQEYMAMRLDIVQSTYQELETGKSPITIGNLSDF